MEELTKILIEKASEKELVRILKIMEALAIELPRDLFIPATKKEIENAVYNKNSFMLVAKIDETICGGCIIIKPNKEYHYFDLAPFSECIVFDSLFLLPEFRGLNIPRLLIQKALETIKIEHKDVKYTYCSINNKNTKSLKMMTNAGFTYHATKNLYGGFSRDIYFLEL